MPVLHSEALGYHPQLPETYSLIKVPCVDIRFYNRIELQYPKAYPLCLF